MPSTSGALSGPRLRVEPASIVSAKKAFQDALDGVNAQLTRIRTAHTEPWAADPVSAETATAFNNRTSGDDPMAAERILTEYANQLYRSWEALDGAEKAYRRTEGQNSAMWGARIEA